MKTNIHTKLGIRSYTGPQLMRSNRMGNIFHAAVILFYIHQ